MPLSNLRKGDSVIARKGSEKCPIYIFRPSTRYWLGNPPYISHRNPYSQRIERWHVARARIILEYGRTVSSRRGGACCALLEAGGGARLWLYRLRPRAAPLAPWSGAAAAHLAPWSGAAAGEPRYGPLHLSSCSPAPPQGGSGSPRRGRGSSRSKSDFSRWVEVEGLNLLAGWRRRITRSPTSCGHREYAPPEVQAARAWVLRPAGTQVPERPPASQHPRSTGWRAGSRMSR